ncbi:hypothetical protein C1H46_010267 [Malus baccata]|uniref:Uncharacterized protein n=1 Tax=Malus baccata TaxID=106549 RepID=A0A540MZB9_MALBA|nr:hypothetical protein C1H46_010267 [Malus baccata]
MSVSRLTQLPTYSSPFSFSQAVPPVVDLEDDASLYGCSYRRITRGTTRTAQTPAAEETFIEIGLLENKDPLIER